eukprot:UN16453
MSPTPDLQMAKRAQSIEEPIPDLPLKRDPLLLNLTPKIEECNEPANSSGSSENGGGKNERHADDTVFKEHTYNFTWTTDEPWGP